MITGDGWSKAENVLCVRLDTIGDVLMTTPALRALKESSPSRRITLLTSAPGASIASMVPEVDQVIVYAAPWIKATPPRSNSRPEHLLVEQLRRGTFEAAVIFTVYSQNPLPAGLLCYLADIPLRLAHCHENPYQVLTNWVQDREPECGVRHEVRRQLDLVATIGAYTEDEHLSLHLPEGATERVCTIVEEAGLDLRQPWAVLHPGATAPSRRYPPAQFAEVARRMVQELHCQVVFTGNSAEVKLVERIHAAMRAPAISLVGRLDLGEMAALLALAPILISNNTGPVHMAAALSTPVVDLYALTNPQHTPWQVPNRVLFHDVPCKYCFKSVCPQGHHRCLRLVPPEDVVIAADELLQETRVPQFALEMTS